MPANKNLSNVNIGTSPNSGDGDLLRDAFIKINNNLNSIYDNGQFLTYGSDNNFIPGYSYWFSELLFINTTSIILLIYSLQYSIKLLFKEDI